MIAEHEYDFVILGTGLVECAVGCILARKNKRVILLDRNPMYGSDFATLRYTELETYFQSPSIAPELEVYDTEFSIDLTPKLFLADSKMLKMLVRYGIDEYLEFCRIPGSFLWRKKLHPVPTNEAQSMTTGLIGIWQKPKVMRFFWNVRDYAREAAKGKAYKFKDTMREEFKEYGLTEESMELIGHGIALNLDDSYLDRHPKETFDKIVTYVRSIICYENSMESPYLYPRYGLSEIAQGFARSCCTKGGEIMINAEILEVNEKNVEVLVREPVNKNVLRIKAGKIISGQSYFQRSTLLYEIIRGICIIRGDPVCVTRGASSAQIIFLKEELKRRNDIFVVVLGSEEKSTPEGYKVAIISTVKETSDPENEIKVVLEKLGDIVRYFVDVKPVYRAEDTENVIFTKGVDESPHFEDIYEEIEGICKKLNVFD
ncbi:SECRETORY PATHWAY GDP DISSOCIATION INHIBITOR ALPHA [Encephalitozoon cuniculi GB-M1]|uniref:Rab GDP dissociation inhibitor n=1 Tax=Encephalitozoon cuniculi (strain GB-M1) TaxID=284813 RepID=Q8SSD5_ENCCU|nr:RAB protein geranylgeranyltransferase subunit A [Encephalitozoon cuniculi GB-M1]KMV66659.1 RAB protein geranylgeranyltransferase subunit A [Encephalitozoon cuniculi EcunIII-L]UYI28335.1 Rab GDP dissociation inhibitor [Encephalitozoon cuniculi]CAD25170.1 SECRETORY PATHWAY GDP DISSOCIATION INHIBITOR ALPHA [Encephalitozoon cuniculi GB-M1]